MPAAPALIAAGAGLVAAAALSVPASGTGPGPGRPPDHLPLVRGPVEPILPVGPVGPVASRPALGARFGWPLSPVPSVLRRFALGPHPWSPGHRGVDLAAAVGRPVLAAGAGVVTFAGVVAGRGVVAVGHPGGVRTTYEPVDAAVRAGQPVAAGIPLGVLTAGDHCPRACLHWGALRGDVYVDPLTLLRPPAPPVLLPLFVPAPAGPAAAAPPPDPGSVS